MTLRTICFFVLIDVIIGAQLINCPQDDIKFKKILGLRPSDSNHPLLLYRNDPYTNNKDKPIVIECLEKCRNNNECRSFVIYYNVTICYWFRTTIQGVQEMENVADINVAWFVKDCLEVRNCEKLWIFEIIPGATLVGNDTKILPNRITRSECQQNCLNEENFKCKSAKFQINMSTYGPNDEIRGICILSDADRHSLPNAYRASSYNEEYFENQCIINSKYVPANATEFCSFEEYNNATLLHRDLYFQNETKETCEELCKNLEVFNCRGYSLVRSVQNYDCFLHSEDSKVHGPKLLMLNPFGAYYEKTQCLNISIICTETYMTVNFSPKLRFMGRMYMEGYSEQPECFASGYGFNTLTLKLPVLSNQCGIFKATAPGNRTLITGSMILQYNPLVQTQGDRIIRIGCIYGTDNKVLIGTGINITSGTPNKGTAIFNMTSTASQPIIEMRVVDLNSKNEVSSTEIGQELQLVIEVKPSDSLDIWAGHLIAMTENSSESILLLDERGCPTNLDIFPAFTKISTNNSKKLVATFQAFKFSSSPIVRFSVIVQFCPNTCPTIDCGNYKRKKREIVTKPLETINNTKITRLNRSEFDNLDGYQRMPLEFIMIVRSQNANSDKLVLGDSKILVAGYDYKTNEVCLDYSLFIGLLITFTLIQLIFVVSCIVLVRRYKNYYKQESLHQSLEHLHKNFGIGFSNLEHSRRVHWADNGDYK